VTTTRPLGLGIVGAGRFASFVADATAGLPDVSLRAVADMQLGNASALAARYQARATADWTALLRCRDIDVVVVATPPSSHREIASAALDAGRHVLCEKPLSTSESDARQLVSLVENSSCVLVVDHVLRYNPILRALTRLQGSLLGEVQRFCFENDASDEFLPADHWFWDTSQSGGIFVEHGVHFFDAAAMLIGRPVTSVQASAARRNVDGPVDMVSATALHGGDVLATHTHSFTHAQRCERQLMRLDYGAAEARVDGWIPVDAVINAWTDDDGVRVAEELPNRVADVMVVDGFRLTPRCSITTEVHRNANGSAQARGRGAHLDIPHRVRVHLTLGGPTAKDDVYAESVRAAMADLVSSTRRRRSPFSGVREGAEAVAVAAVATRAAAVGRTVLLDHRGDEETRNTFAPTKGMSS
jgi:predicted dehydrogenase